MVDPLIQQTDLPGGLRVVSAMMTGVESVSIGTWINAGARDELDREHGMAHMLEHMAFKGTSTRSAADIAREVEDIGGYINAHTSSEETAYYLRILPEDLAFGVDLLADILIRSTFPEDEIMREKGVIIQEIGQANDTPDDIVFDLSREVSFPDHTLGRPILGTTDSVNSFVQADIHSFKNRHYHKNNIIISAAGALDHDFLVRQVERNFAELGEESEPCQRPKPSWPDQARTRCRTITRDLEQTHLVIGFAGLPAAHEEMHILSALSVLYGGGMSSRLFQEAREKQGLCYSVFSFPQGFSDSGYFGIYAGTSQEDALRMVRLAGDQLKDVATGATDEETRRAITQISANLRMRQESVVAVGETLPRHLQLYGEVRSTTSILEQIKGVSSADIRSVAQRLLEQPPSLAAIGPEGVAELEDQALLDQAFCNG